MVILTDFDGTITREDVLDEILEHFADKEWMQIEQRWLAGEIGSLDCLTQQMALVKTGASELETFLDSITIDPSFEAFLQYCFAQEIPLKIVSDNFRWFIRHILRKNLPEHHSILDRIPIYSNEVKLMGTRLEFSFPYSGAACVHGCATCKAELVKKIKSEEKDEIVFIGDGLSDRYGAREADLVFGKSKLIDYCRQDRIEVIPFEQFTKIHEWIKNKKSIIRQNPVSLD